MRRVIAARAGQTLVVVFLVTTISFFLIRLAPGEPFAYEGYRFNAQLREQLRHQFGYDRPVAEQYVRYVANVARGNLGYSHSLRRPVSEAIVAALPRTILLMAVALALSFAAGIAVAVFQASRRGTLVDRGIGTSLLLLYSVPDFWLAIVVLLAFAYWIPIFPAGGMIDPVMYDYMSNGARLVDRLKHLVLPAITLAALAGAGIARYQRAALLDVLPLDFVRTALAKGVSPRIVLVRHALRNALLPTITLFGLLLPALAGGAFFVEKVFSWPGMGFLVANAIGARDYDLVTGAVIVGGVMVALGNLLADLLYLAADPRLRAR